MRSLALGLVLGAAAACTEGMSPGPMGQLRVRAVFATGEEPATLGVVVNDIRIVVRRNGGSGAVAVDTTVPFEPDATLSWILDLTTPPESLGITAQLGQGSLALYEGASHASVAEGIGSSSGGVNDVPVRFLGKPIKSIDVTPGSATVQSLGSSQQYTAVARDAQGAVVPGVSFSWSTSNAAVVSIDSTGLATGLAVGTVSITASTEGISGGATMVVTQAVATVTVSPDSATVKVTGSVRFTAKARDANGHLIPGTPFAWKSSDTSVAKVTAILPDTGLAEALAVGTTILRATAAGVSDTAKLTVFDDNGGQPGPIASIEVTPPVATITAIDADQQFTAVARDTNGNAIPGVTFTWSSSHTSVAKVNATGLAIATGAGVTTITASALGLSGTATLNVIPLPAFIRITPPSATIAKGDGMTFTAVVFDANGYPVPGAPVAWSSSNPAIATVGATTGQASGLAHGTVAVTATSGGASAAASLEVVEVAQVIVQPGSEPNVPLGGSVQFTAIVRDINGRIVTGLKVSWSSSDPSVASIDADTGLARGLKRGSTFISARVGGVTGRVRLEVN
jgi:uncharacterized protein YjdB